MSNELQQEKKGDANSTPKPAKENKKPHEGGKSGDHGKAGTGDKPHKKRKPSGNAKPDNGKKPGPKAEGGKPENNKKAGAKAEGGKPENNKKAGSKAEGAKQEHTKKASPKSEGVKAENAKKSNAKTGNVKADNVKKAGPKAEAAGRDDAGKAQAGGQKKAAPRPKKKPAAPKQIIPSPVSDKSLDAILSDSEVKYVLDLKENRIHEKYCKALLRIPSKKLVPSTKYRDDLRQCDYCAIEAYVRSGAGDHYNINAYKEFFDKVGLTPGLLRFLYVTMGATTELKDGELIINRGDDTWKIVPEGDTDEVTLYHNSYKVRGGQRVFSGRFHIENEEMRRTSAKAALNCIKDFAWNEGDSDESGSGPGESGSMGGFFDRVAAFFTGVRDAGAEEPRKDYRISIGDFTPAGKDSFPENGQRCVFIYKDDSGATCWDVGSYSKRHGSFAVSDGGGKNKSITPKDKVLAWKLFDEVGGQVSE